MAVALLLELSTVEWVCKNAIYVAVNTAINVNAVSLFLHVLYVLITFLKSCEKVSLFSCLIIYTAWICINIWFWYFLWFNWKSLLLIKNYYNREDGIRDETSEKGRRYFTGKCEEWSKKTSNDSLEAVSKRSRTAIERKRRGKVKYSLLRRTTISYRLMISWWWSAENWNRAADHNGN